VLRSLTGAIHLLTLPNGREALLVWLGVLVSFWDQSLDSLENGRQLFRQDKTQEESALPQGRGDSLVAQLDSDVNQAEQFRDQQIQQQYSDQLGVYVQEKAQQIGNSKSIPYRSDAKRSEVNCEYIQTLAGTWGADAFQGRPYRFWVVE
jgi:hypothetical protein